MEEQVTKLLYGIAPILWQGKSIILSNGAMATFLHQIGISIRTCSEILNLSCPEQIMEVHKDYIAAGANVIQTNTFSANRSGLSRFDRADDVQAINRAGAQIALRAANGQAAVFGTIGSILGVHLYATPLDEDQRQHIRLQFSEQVEALLSEPIHGILLETFPDLEEMLLAITVVRAATNLPIVANLAPDELGVTRDGVPIEQAFVAMQEAGATVVGLNCKLGPNGILHAFESTPLHPNRLYAAVPNAGLLHRIDGDYAYTGSEQYFADMVHKLLVAGVSWVGGCCGTTPAHIRLARTRIEQDIKIGVRVVPPKPPTMRWEQPPIVGKTHGTSEEKMIRSDVLLPSERSLLDTVKNEVTVIVELDPPKTFNCDPFLKGARVLTEAGANYITLADNSLATVRVSNLAMATLLKLNQIEPLVHVACRDRNLIGQQSHLMGLDVLGVRHILLITGDPSKFGDLPGATSVYDVASIDLTKMVRRLNEGIGFSGRMLERKARFVVGTSFNPQFLKLEKGITRLQRKIEAGADFVMTQPVFDIRLMEKMKRASEDLNIPVFLGVMPLVSARNALFLHHEVPGITIPDEILKQMQGVDKEHGEQVGLQIAKNLLNHALSMFNGIYLITPFMRYGMTAQLTHYAKSKQNVLLNEIHS